MAARALLGGGDPYVSVERRGMNFPLFYPVSAIVAFIPFGALPLAVARAAWAGVGAALLFLAGRRYGRGLPAALLSAGTVSALLQGQWSPYLTAAVVWPWFAGIWAAKPTLGLALFAARPSWRALVTGAALVGVGWALVPEWVGEWRRALLASQHVPLIFRPGGFVLLAALLRWRQPEGRLLAVLACVPQTTALYETVPLFLIPRTKWEGYGLAGLSYLAAFGGAVFVPKTPGVSLEQMIAGRWPYVLVFMHLPALLILLRGASSKAEAASEIATGNPR